MSRALDFRTNISFGRYLYPGPKRVTKSVKTLTQIVVTQTATQPLPVTVIHVKNNIINKNGSIKVV